MPGHIDINDDDYALMRQAFREASNCKASDSAFSVGSILTTMDRQVLALGYSREFGQDWHAEEVAIEKASRKLASLDSCILYSTLEPCGDRVSRPASCCQLILNKNIPVVVFAENEPNSFVDTPRGAEILTANSIQVLQLDGFKGQFDYQNNHVS